MFGTIRRHQSWLLYIIVGATIVSFVWFFNPSGKGGGGGRGGTANIGVIDGHHITPKELGEAMQETRLLYFLNYRKFPDQDESAQQRGFDLEREATLRLVRLAKAREANIQVADSTVGEFAKRLLGGDPSRMAQFETEVLKPAGLTGVDFERFVRNEAAVQQLSALYGAAGRLVTPAEAEQIYRRENQEVAAQVALFTVSNYLGRVAVSNDALHQWYTNQLSRYRTPEQVSVSYLVFPRTNFVAEADKQVESISNLNVRLQEVYYKIGTNNFKDTNGNVLPPDKAMAKIKSDERDRMAMSLARKHAIDIANIIYEALNTTNQPSATLLDQVAKTNNLTVQVTKPFDAEFGPTNLDVGPNFAQAAFSLSTTNPVLAQPIEGEDGFYIIALKGNIPSRAQSYDEVKEKVANDYKMTQAFTIMRTEAMDFQSRLTNALTAGKKFEEVAAASKVKVITLPPISRTTDSLTNLDDVVNVQQVKNAVFSIDSGKTSPLLPNGAQGAFIVYVGERLPVNEAKLKEELPKFLAEIRYMRQNQLFHEWFTKQVEKAAPQLPSLQKPATPPRRG
jgi:hypothetical protein